jgi:hypothetical protein
LQVSYDPDLGYPTSVAIDLSAFIADEEISYQLSDVNFVDAPGLVMPSTSLKLRFGEGYQRVNDVRIVGIYKYRDVYIECIIIGSLMLAIIPTNFCLPVLVLYRIWRLK